MNKPNFFLLGAAKSGTTTLYHYLNKHPGIYMAKVKEPSFFCDTFQVVKNPIHYFQLFDEVDNEACIGEASHVYMTNPTTAEVLYLLFPHAKFIVILRNPVDRAYSLFQHMRRHGYETAQDFNLALKLENKRFHSETFTKNCQQYFYNYMYYRSGLYTEQLRRYYTWFSKEQFHIVSLQMLREDPRNTISKIYRFLGVNDDFFPNVSIQNRAQLTCRNASFNHFVKNYWGSNSKKKYKPISSVLNRINRTWNQTELQPLDLNLRLKLLADYNRDMPDLKILTGLSLDEL